jgi:hypothetical protein
MMALAIAMSGGIVSASAQSTTGSDARPVTRYCGTPDPFRGALDPFHDTLDLLRGNIDPFRGNLDPFKGTPTLTTVSVSGFWTKFDTD